MHLNTALVVSTSRVRLHKQCHQAGEDGTYIVFHMHSAYMHPEFRLALAHCERSRDDSISHVNRDNPCTNKHYIAHDLRRRILLSQLESSADLAHPYETGFVSACSSGQPIRKLCSWISLG